MIEEKTFKIGKVTILKFDWFELTKYLSVLNGILISVAFVGFYLLFEKSKIQGLFMSIFALVSFFVFGQVINIIRDQNPDNNIRIKQK